MTRTPILRTERGHVHAEDPEHVARAIRAIRARRLQEVELSFAPAKSNVVQMRKAKRGNSHVRS